VPVYRTRSRLVYFRVSEEEFAEYTRFCQAHGARSLSDMAREAVTQMLDLHKHAGEEADEGLVSERLKSLDDLTRALTDRLEKVHELLKQHQSNETAENRAGDPESEQHAVVTKTAS